MCVHFVFNELTKVTLVEMVLTASSTQIYGCWGGVWKNNQLHKTISKLEEDLTVLNERQK